MTPFIYPYQLNAFRFELNRLLSVVYFAGDYRVYNAAKSTFEEATQRIFGSMTSEQSNLFDGALAIKGKKEMNDLLASLLPYVISFPYDAKEIRQLFKREKKFTLPDFSSLDLKAISYLGWRDISKNLLYLIYPYQGHLAGIRARYTVGSKHAGVCSLCNGHLRGNDVGLVVALTKKSTYESVGNYMCLDSLACNERLRSVESIEAFFHRVLS